MPASLKFRTDLPWQLEIALQTKHGYYLRDRIYGDGVTFVKKPPKPAGTIVDNNPLSPIVLAVRVRLDVRMDNLVAHYPDPYKSVPSIRIRLHNMAQSLQNADQRQYVLDYMEENFPSDGKGI